MGFCLVFFARTDGISDCPSRHILEDSWALLKFLIFYSFVPSCIRRGRLFQFEKDLTYLLLQQQQYPVSFVLFGNDYMLVANNKLEGRIADLFVTVIVDSEAEGRGCY